MIKYMSVQRKNQPLEQTKEVTKFLLQSFKIIKQTDENRKCTELICTKLSDKLNNDNK